MQASITERVVALEQDFADFYARIKRQARFRDLKFLFQSMEDACRQHAVRIERLWQDQCLPTGAPIDAIFELQESIKRSLHQSLSEELLREPDLVVVYRKLAAGEETLALVYSRVAHHLRALTPEYAIIAADFEGIAAEEIQHRDAILRECRHWEAVAGAPRSPRG